jgi:hypothetical protein
MDNLKIDFKKKYKTLFSQTDKKVSYIEVPELLYLSIDGQGHPENSPDFHQKIGALYGVAFTLKFMLKDPAQQPPGYFDFVVSPLESTWFMKDCPGFDPQRPDDWRWSLMMIAPEYFTTVLLEKACAEIARKGKDTTFAKQVKLENTPGGKAAQIMHLGPYGEVKATVEKLMAEMEANKFEPIGHYREIYLNDPSRVAPEKIKTICRMTFK